MIRLKNSNLYQFSIYFLISLFLITFIPTVIITFNYDYKADWTYTIENKSIADNTFFYEVDTHTTTMVNLLGFRFPNRTILIKINVHKNSDPFKYYIFQAIYINKSQNFIVSVSLQFLLNLPLNNQKLSSINNNQSISLSFCFKYLNKSSGSSSLMYLLIFRLTSWYKSSVFKNNSFMVVTLQQMKLGTCLC